LICSATNAIIASGGRSPGPRSWPGIAQDAELDGEPETVHAAPLGSDECQVSVVKHVLPRHLGRVGRDGKQAIVLLRGQRVRRDMKTSFRREEAFISCLPFNAILKEGMKCGTRGMAEVAPTRS
jgi:hypothetical protein